MDPYLAERLSRALRAKVERDGRVLKAFGRWSACVRRAGPRYGSPWEANDDPHWQTARPSRAEIATAVADVRCKASTGLVRTWSAVEAEYQRTAVRTHFEELARIGRWLTARRVVARRALSRDPALEP